MNRRMQNKVKRNPTLWGPGSLTFLCPIWEGKETFSQLPGPVRPALQKKSTSLDRLAKAPLSRAELGGRHQITRGNRRPIWGQAAIPHSQFEPRHR
jgi:hypothetical protein